MLTQTLILIAICVPAPSVLALCPPPLFPTVDVECSLEGRRVPCDSPQQPGARAAFRCKALHHFLFDYLPATGYASECREDGEWSVRPFRCVPVCGQPTGKPVAFVRNGEKVGSAADYPWHVAIYDVRKNNDQICGGSLISSKYFVSAAHCFFVRSRVRAVEDFLVAMGKTHRSWDNTADVNAQKAAIRSIHVKDYGDRKLQYSNDIALVEMATEVEVDAYVQPVCVDWAMDLPALRDGESGTVVGYGQDVGAPSEDLKFSQLPFVPTEKCKKDVVDSLAVFTHLPDKFCVGYVKEKGATVAQGDSGGGLFFQDVKRSWYLRGVVSVGSTREVTYSLFTNVTAFIPWMAGIIQKGEVSGRRCGVDLETSEVKDNGSLEEGSFPWELEVFFKRNTGSNFTRRWSGTLVQPNLVITALLGGHIDLTALAPTWIRVESLQKSDSGEPKYSSKVRRFHYPRDALAADGRIYTFALLELDTPINLMPACVDWTGNSLLQNQKEGTTILMTGANAESRSWRRYKLQSNTMCKGKDVKFLDYYNFCVFGNEHLEEPSLFSRTIMVNVDNTWYIRGIVADDLVVNAHQFTAVYTDFADKGVQQWLSRTKDIIGKPTCGQINICESIISGSALPGHFPWTVQVVIESDTISSTAAGVVVQSNVVLTDRGRLVYDFGLRRNGSVLTVDPSNVKVVWTALNGSSYLANVVSLFVHQSTVLDAGSITWDVALLELEYDVDVMPICMDLSGFVLEPLQPRDSGVVETWDVWTAQHKLNQVQYVTQLECLQIHFQTGTDYQTLTSPDKFCAGGKLYDKVMSGTPYMTFTGSYWYLRGLSANVIQDEAPYVLRVTDFRNKDLRLWVSSTLKNIRPGRTEKEEPPVLECVGGYHPPNECGRYSPPAVRESTKYFQSMPWMVEVHVDEEHRPDYWIVRAGALVRPDLVLTESLDLLTSLGPNVTGKVSTIPPSSVHIKWLIAGDFENNKRRRVAEVVSILAHERTLGGWKQGAWDVALLQLKTSLPVMPVCLPRKAFGIAPMVKGDYALTQSWGYNATLFNVSFIPGNECKQLLSDGWDSQLTEDRFCGRPLKTDKILHGAPLVTRSGQAWFLRGVNAFSWTSAKRPDIYGFCNISDPDVMTWLEEKMNNKFPEPAVAYFAHATTTTTTTERPVFIKPFPPIEYAPVKTTTPAPTKPPRRRTTEAPVPLDKCGRFDASQLPGSPGVMVRGRMPWAVAILKEKEDSKLSYLAGTLVRPNVVLTQADGLVVPNDWNDTGRAFAIPASRLHVLWTVEGGGRRRSAVKSIHVHERTFGERYDYAYDVAILILKSSYSGTVACLDLDGTLPPMKTGGTGVIDSWNGDYYEGDRYLVRTPFVSISDCKTMVPDRFHDQLTPDRFCMGRLNVTLKDGTGWFTEHKGSWYLRGCKMYYWGSQNQDLFSMVNFEEPAVRAWIQEVLDSYP